MPICIVGKAGSGKDFLRNKFIAKGYKPDISYTTRPMRDGEVADVTYHYISEALFKKLLEQGFFYEHALFNGWHYGTSKISIVESDIFIMTPSGVAQIKPEDRRMFIVMYIDIPAEIRYDRLIIRSDADKVDRRIAADEEDFKNFIDYDVRITNPDF